MQAVKHLATDSSSAGYHSKTASKLRRLLIKYYFFVRTAHVRAGKNLCSHAMLGKQKRPRSLHSQQGGY